MKVTQYVQKQHTETRASNLSYTQSTWPDLTYPQPNPILPQIHKSLQESRQCQADESANPSTKQSAVTGIPSETKIQGGWMYTNT